MTNHTDLLISYRDLMRRALDVLDTVHNDYPIGSAFDKEIHDLMYDLRTAVDSAAITLETGGWLPISEAKKDGKPIMGRCKDHNWWRVFTCFYVNKFEEAMDSFQSDLEDFDEDDDGEAYVPEGWYEATAGDDNFRVYPTEFQPLPPTPNSPSGSE